MKTIIPHPTSSYRHEIMTTPAVQAAFAFSIERHELIGQKRKYTGEPYYHHPLEVAEMVASFGGSVEQIQAALLHDTVEDTPTTLEEVEQHFGAKVAALVESLTDVSKKSDGNRAARKAIDREHTRQASPEAKTIKLCDIISNVKSIAAHDRAFARVYLKEKEALMAVLKEGDAQAYREAQKVIKEAKQLVYS